jgi:hypothetical protein
VNVLYGFESRKVHPSIPDLGSPFVTIAKCLEVVNRRILLTIHGIEKIFLKARPNGN